MQLYSSSLSAVSTFSSLIVSKIFPACFSCINSFNLSKSSLGLEDKNLVEQLFGSDSLNVPATIPFDLSIPTGDLSQVLLLPRAFSSKYISFAVSYISLLSGQLTRSTL